MGRTIAVANQKGGVGKTTTTLNLGSALAELGYTVLVIDADPQGSLTLSCGVNPDELNGGETLYSALAAILKGEAPTLSDIVIRTGAGVDLVPANIELSQADVDLPREPLGVLALRDIIETVRERYDFIIVDTPPNLGALTVAALSAADGVLVPVQADYLAMKGLDLLLRTVRKVQGRINKRLRVEGVLLTLVDIRTGHAREVEAMVRAKLHEGDIHVFKTTIRTNVKLKEAPIRGESILSYARTSPAAEAYRALARELLA